MSDAERPTLRQIAAAMSTVTGDISRDLGHVNARPTWPPPAPTADDLACPECGAQVCVCDDHDPEETLP